MTRARVFKLIRRTLAAGMASVLALSLALAIAVWREPLPSSLASPSTASVRIVDRGGRLLREVRTENSELSASVRSADLSPWVVPALLAAEDRRFFQHAGVDPLAMLRAALQLVREGHVVSGASTLTQQLARTVAPHPRTLRGKLREIVVALCIERSLDKRRILEEYLSRVEFGPNIRGIEAASRYYFDKPARALDLAEAATLSAIPRGPTLYDPKRGADRLERRKQRVLTRLGAEGVVDARTLELARQAPLRLAPGERPVGAQHVVAALTSGAFAAELGKLRSFRNVETTLDAGLQRDLEVLSGRAAVRLRDHGASALSLLVLDNATGDILAYVGSPDFFDRPALGQNDGVRALRQPGSTLKPLLYAAAMQELGMTAATLLPDIELSLPSQSGVFSPKNYDRRAHGPVLLREALASSLNVPAVVVTNRLGVERALQALHRDGFASLTGDAGDYGVALALGDGEVQLLELVRAYAMLARGGTLVRERLVRSLVDTRGVARTVERPPPERVLDARLAAIVTDILADDAARASAFGRGSVLELPFPVAVKTGTSKGYRDNWTVGYTREVTVGVWVGNFDASPMIRSSGVTGAGPLFHDAMLAAMRDRAPAPLVDPTGLVAVEVCALSGALPADVCPHRRRELFVSGHEPHEHCSMHERVAIDPTNELRAGSGCRSAEQRVFERYPAEYAAWASEAGRPVAPSAFSPRCPGVGPTHGEAPSIAFPLGGTKFHLDPDGPRQEIVLAARAPTGQSVEFLLDGKSVGRASAPFRLPWALERGTHRLEVVALGTRGETVRFEVE